MNLHDFLCAKVANAVLGLRFYDFHRDHTFRGVEGGVALSLEFLLEGGEIFVLVKARDESVLDFYLTKESTQIVLEFVAVVVGVVSVAAGVAHGENEMK